jgi:hypothetical protein
MNLHLGMTILALVLGTPACGTKGPTPGGSSRPHRFSVDSSGGPIGAAPSAAYGGAAHAPAITVAKSEATDESESGTRLAKASPQVASATSPTSADEKLVVNGSVSLVAEDVPRVTRDLRAQAAARRGSLVSEVISGAEQGIQAAVRVRLPPPEVTPFLDWLATQGRIESRRLEATDVSREYFDQALAIKNLELTMGRLQQLVSRPGAELKEVLEIERELTRVRGELERLKGQHRFLQDQVARATLSISITTRAGAIVPLPPLPEQKFVLVASGSLLWFVDESDREQLRPGGGVSVMFSRVFALHMDIFPGRAGNARSFLFSAAGATYSDFLGGGRRRFFNPYLGLRLAAGAINDRSAFGAGAEVGVELYRHRLFLVDLSGRVLGLWYDKEDTEPPGARASDIAIQGVLGIGAPF